MIGLALSKARFLYEDKIIPMASRQFGELPVNLVTKRNEDLRIRNVPHVLIYPDKTISPLYVSINFWLAYIVNNGIIIAFVLPNLHYFTNSHQNSGG